MRPRTNREAEQNPDGYNVDNARRSELDRDCWSDRVRCPLITILIAVRALGSWKRTLRNQRIDECISAAYDLVGSFERYKAVKSKHKISTTAEAFDQLLTSFRDFDRAYTVVGRSF
jgi:hypothetical protein